MNDEADVYYEDSIDQMTFGHKFLLETFNVTPTIGWHIDPFGHAAAQASLFAQMGFNAFYFSRIDYQDHADRLINKGMEMVWQPITSQGSDNAILTGVNYNHYESPPYFCFDIRCSDTPPKNDHRLEGYNMDVLADYFVNYFQDMAYHYKTPVLFHTLGTDFNYQAAYINFMDYDLLLDYISSDPQYDWIDIKYSTMERFTKELYEQKVSFPMKYDDFFPYADEDNAYWTGYFTSRTALKGYVRKIGRFAQAIKKLVSLQLSSNRSQYIINNWYKVDTALYVMEEAMAIAQHHDAVAGTEKQAVAEDYAYILSNATETLNKDVVYPLVQEDLNNYLNLRIGDFTTCETNRSANDCLILRLFAQNQTTVGSILVTLYNPTQNSRDGRVVRVKITTEDVVVYDIEGQKLNSTVICANMTEDSDCDLYFKASTLSPFSFSYYFIQKSESKVQKDEDKTCIKAPVVDQSWFRTHTASVGFKPHTIVLSESQNITLLDYGRFNLSYCIDSGRQQDEEQREEFDPDVDCYNTTFNLSYKYYPSYQNTSEQSSGAYIFRPEDNHIDKPIPYAKWDNVTIWRGPMVLQISLFSENVTTHLRVYDGDWTRGVEIETFVNSIDVEKRGKEIIMQVVSDSINNNYTSYTDSMGLEMQKRIFNYRPTWNLTVMQPVSGNYYPINSAIYIEDVDSKERMTVSNDRPQAGGNIFNGEIELMLHRRLVDDDARGVGEPLNETDWDGNGLRQYIVHHLHFSKPGFVKGNQRKLQFDRDQPMLQWLSPLKMEDLLGIRLEGRREVEGEAEDGLRIVDDMVKVLLRARSLSSHLVRFHNMNEDKEVELGVEVLDSRAYGKMEVSEMSLTANQKKEDMIKNRYNWLNYTEFEEKDVPRDYLDKGVIVLRPLEIRTFLVKYGVSKEMEGEEWLRVEVVDV